MRANQPSEGSRAVSGRPRCWSCIDSRPHPQGWKTTIPSHLFHLHRPMWPSPRRFWPPSRSMCPHWGAWRRGFALESGAASTNTFVRDLDIPTATLEDSRRLEVVVDGLLLHGGAQLAVDTTLVSTLHGDARPRKGAADWDGVALLAARKWKERRYPEFLGARCRARLVVLAVEVGGRFLSRNKRFLSPSWQGPAPGARFR